MYDPIFTDWLEDDLNSIDSSSLFRPDEASPSFNIYNTSPSHAEYFQNAESETIALDSGYISSNSSDSGKHSPSGSESTVDHDSPWVFPPIIQNYSNERRESNIADQSHFHHECILPDVPQTSTQSSTYITNNIKSQTITPQTSQCYYIVPNSSNIAPTNITSRIPANLNYSVSNQRVYVKAAEPTLPTVYLKAESPVTPIYISQTTGAQLQPIPASTHSMKKILVTRAIKEEEIRRIEDRKAKNREAAQISRANKKREVDDLKHTVSILTTENQKLKHEVNRLREKLSKYEKDQIESSPPRKRAAIAGTALMAVFMVMIISPIGLSSLTSKPPTSSIAVNKLTNTGRVLSMDTIPVSQNISGLSNCANKKLYNSTEAIRLNSDLYEWVERHETMGIDLKGKRRLLQKKQNDWLSAVGNIRINVTENAEKNRRKKFSKEDRVWRHLDMISVAGGSARERRERVRKFLKTERGNDRTNYEKLTSSIQQKDDTLYVVTLEDYFLLPALERNFTSTPRVTLILPALSHNSTTANKVTLMRIDLRVVGTGLFQLSRQLLPLFLQ